MCKSYCGAVGQPANRNIVGNVVTIKASYLLKGRHSQNAVSRGLLNSYKIIHEILAFLAATSYKEITGSIELKDCQM